MAGQNTYDQGQCTWYCAGQKSWVQPGWGNASNWLSAASAAGLPTGSAPMAGGICVWGPGNESANAPASASGHVADVESVNSDGSFVVSEMNFNGGVGVVDYRTVHSMAGIIGFIYPPGSKSQAATAGASSSSQSLAGSVGSVQLGQSYGASAAQGVLAMGGKLISWANGRDVALLVAALVLYMLFAPELKGGPQVRL